MALKAFLLLIALALAGGAPAAAQTDRRDREAIDRFFMPSSTLRRGFLGVEEYFAKMKASQEESGGLVYTLEELDSPLAPAFEDPAVVYAEPALAAHEFQKAREQLLLHMVPGAVSPPVKKLADRLIAVQYFFPSLDVEKGQWAQALALGLHDFLHGRDAHAVLRVSYALSLNPAAPKVEAFLERLEAITRRKGERIPTGTGLSLLETKLNASENAFKAGRYDEMMRLNRDVLVLWPEHPTALSRLGSGYYLKGEKRQAKAVWKLALRLEGRSSEREALERMIAAPPRPAVRPAPQPKVDAAAAGKLYREGIAAYTQGDWMRAEEKFKNILKLDPGNAKAKKALRRIENEKP